MPDFLVDLLRSIATDPALQVELARLIFEAVETNREVRAIAMRTAASVLSDPALVGALGEERRRQAGARSAGPGE